MKINLIMHKKNNLDLSLLTNTILQFIIGHFKSLRLSSFHGISFLYSCLSLFKIITNKPKNT